MDRHGFTTAACSLAFIFAAGSPATAKDGKRNAHARTPSRTERGRESGQPRVYWQKPLTVEARLRLSPTPCRLRNDM